MFGSRLQLRATTLSAHVLHGIYNYASILGFISFRINSNRRDGQLQLLAEHSNRRMWLAGCARILIFGLHVYLNASYLNPKNLSHLKLLIAVRMACSFVCVVLVLALQFRYADRVTSMVNQFLRLFRKVNDLPGSELKGFGGQKELILLLLCLLSQLYQSTYILPTLISEGGLVFTIEVLLETYLNVSVVIMCHTCALGYLSLGALYAQLNDYVSNPFKQQLQSLGTTRYQQRLANYRMDECLAIYDGIYHVYRCFQRLFDTPLFFVLVFGFLTMAMISFFMVLSQFDNFAMLVMELKILLDILLMTLSIYSADSSSRIIRSLSLENFYRTENNIWHRKLELFLNRLNYCEFRVRPWGLFDVSNELILVFISALITYLTYIVQYTSQNQM